MDNVRSNTGGNAPRVPTTVRTTTVRITTTTRTSTRRLLPTTTARTTTRVPTTTRTSTRRLLPTTTTRTSYTPPPKPPTTTIRITSRSTPKPAGQNTPPPKPPTTTTKITSRGTTRTPAPVVKYGVPGPTTVRTPAPVAKYGVPGPTTVRTPAPVVKYGVPGPTTMRTPVPTIKTIPPAVKYGPPTPTYNLDKIYAGIKGLDVSIIYKKISETINMTKNSVIKAGNESLGALYGKTITSSQEILDDVKDITSGLSTLNQNQIKPALKKVEELQDTLEERAKLKKQISEYEKKYSAQRGTVESYLSINPDRGNLADERTVTNADKASSQVELKKVENQLYELKQKLRKIEDKAFDQITYVKKLDGSPSCPVPPIQPIGHQTLYGVMPYTPPQDPYIQSDYGVPYKPPQDVYYQPEYGVPYKPPQDVYYQPEYGVPYKPPQDVYYQPEYGVPYVTTKYGIKCADPE